MNRTVKERTKVDRKRKADRRSKAVVSERVLKQWRTEWVLDTRRNTV
jgi:hypothetical protein